MLSGFRAFLLRGNVVDLAVAVVIGAAFGAVVTAFVKDLITPLIAALFGKPDFSAIGFTINNARFLVGDFINALIAFVLVAAAVYYAVVLPMQHVDAWRKRGEPLPPATKECPYCLETVPVAASKCRACTSALGVASA
ncbi:large-conductance mechanosensitive channel [Vulcanimicrobium alpinum]|uniref:Large-conductance mechanosensitive channel n=1 Tax=Vulcanimicrobium alpinum TaxID=3016050 RepID=A0AAN1Y013_UNVUL|nr:large-conductance mechanosensitive channel [Vulcanimicrobium alpinum]